MTGVAENVDHVDGTVNVGQRGDEGFSEQLLSDMAGINRNHVVAALGQIFEREIARPHVGRRGTDHRDRFHVVEDAPDVIVGIGVVVHLLLSLTSW